MTSRAVDEADVAVTLAECFRPSGRRLGIVVTIDLPARHIDAAASAVGAAGLMPERRLSRLRPRVGEDSIRAADVADYVERYGHEYAIVVLPEQVAWPADDRAAIIESCARQGCELIWVGGDASN